MGWHRGMQMRACPADRGKPCSTCCFVQLAADHEHLKQTTSACGLALPGSRVLRRTGMVTSEAAIANRQQCRKWPDLEPTQLYVDDRLADLP